LSSKLYFLFDELPVIFVNSIKQLSVYSNYVQILGLLITLRTVMFHFCKRFHKKQYDL